MYIVAQLLLDHIPVNGEVSAGDFRKDAAGSPAAMKKDDLTWSPARGGMGSMQTSPPSGSLSTWTQLIYALHALSLLTGIFGAATVIGAFLIGWPSLIGVILNYVKRSEARGTWLDSHFTWQIRTFWYGLLWVALCGLFVLFTFGIGLIIVWLPLAIVSLWFIYRVVRGWLRLRSGRAMYV